MNEQEIFTEALERDPVERKGYLDGACRDNPVLRMRVEELLAAHENAANFMNQRDDAVAPTLAPAVPEEPGTQIGAYTIREQIGEGGFGLVYVAEQAKPVRRRVALKVIKPGMDSKEVIARFEAERQALALMNHPNVARVLDAGATENGRPFFVMELVHGLPMTEFCDKNKLPTRERLKLFLDVCRAVHHAHQKGIIHRDLKPSNIMVTLHDGQPVPKVIDFGVAKALSQQLTEKTIYTNYGQVVGTPQYMSPEQAEMSGLGIDTRSDIYSLGVLLYELLTGTSPVDRQRLLASGYAEMLRIIREEEPPRPSRRISTLGQQATAVAHHRGTDQKKLSRSLRGELDWIVMKALEKDRDRRYETASSFADDIRRFLEHEPVHARATSSVYQARKYLSRHPGRIATAISVIAAMMFAVGMLVSIAHQGELSLVNNRLRSSNRGLASAKGQLEVSVEKTEKMRKELELVKYFGDVSGALAAWDHGEVRRAERLLEICPPPLRHWEWHYTHHRLHKGVATLAESGWVQSVSVTADGRRIASASDDEDQSVVSVWDLQTKRKLFSHNHESNVYRVTFHPDGRYVALGGASDVSIWDLDSDEVRQLRDHQHSGQVHVAFSRDGRYLLSGGGRDGQLVLWDFESRQTVLPPVEFGPGILSVTFDALGEHFAGCGWHGGPHGAVKIWETKSGELIHHLDHEDGRVWCVAFSPDGKIIASGCREKIWLWDARSGKTIGYLEGHKSWVRSIKFHRDGELLASGSYDQTIRLWDVKSRTQVRRLQGHKDTVTELSFFGEGNQVASGSRDRTVRIWQSDLRQDALTLTTQGSENSLAFHPHGQMIVSGGDDGIARIWDVKTGREIVRLEGHEQAVRAVDWSPGGDIVATGGLDGTVRIWEADSGKCHGIIWKHSKRIFDVDFDAEGHRLLAASLDGAVRVLDVKTGRVLFEHDHGPLETVSVTFHPDGGCFAMTTAFDRMLRVYDSLSNEQVQAWLSHDYYVRCASYGPNGDLLATGGRDMKVKIWDSTSGAQVKAIDSDDWVEAIAFSPDAKRIAGAVNDVIKIWDVTSGQEALSLRGHDGFVLGVRFSPDGRRLASVSRDGSIRIWDTGTTEFVRLSD